MELRVSGTVKESVVDGPGLRFVIFTQGCEKGCPGCHNPDTWDLTGGTLVETKDLLEQIKSAKLIKGVTFSGGEPFLQALPLAWIGREVKMLGLDVITYTGYVWEELLALADLNQPVRELLLLSDYIVDGPFIIAERDLELPFRGSRNQRVIDVVNSLKERKIIEWNASFN
ncbi:radical SAM protein [Pelotomaculum terephthalicicum JT]|uniref:4Fe-4S single cluster domain-containing protein n=1 Tax=Pelotomaculum TaxID=191373 RepID=UPI0009C7B56C|nr:MULTISPECIES: 4Fe-4S single cluster domain-containing protein [Pelotomaculum]MCG9968061.1 radical SAM protein [Pelotomaculum terephthalicicum JT]OPX85640.1 MAG: Pyruvate formate-lyase 1-activating enzyme [Pelotomaculum sp. PtaB.Bin117]OPY63988.1 MAG: Pyruvate formate-lyase 1-activating enzyme [Pelotomaculum sp. PtaU1.Bin065]